MTGRPSGPGTRGSFGREQDGAGTKRALRSSPPASQTTGSTGEDSIMAIDAAVPRSRRAILTAAIGGLAATAAHAVGRPATALATDNQPILQGQTNTGTLSTVVAVANTTALQGVTDA